MSQQLACRDRNPYASDHSGGLDALWCCTISEGRITFQLRTQALTWNSAEVNINSRGKTSFFLVNGVFIQNACLLLDFVCICALHSPVPWISLHIPLEAECSIQKGNTRWVLVLAWKSSGLLHSLAFSIIVSVTFYPLCLPHLDGGLIYLQYRNTGPHLFFCYCGGSNELFQKYMPVTLVPEFF